MGQLFGVSETLAEMRTPRSSSPSSLCRGITVTCSISHRKPTSEAVRPGGRGNAMLECRTWQLSYAFDISISSFMGTSIRIVIEFTRRTHMWTSDLARCGWVLSFAGQSCSSPSKPFRQLQIHISFLDHILRHLFLVEPVHVSVRAWRRRNRCRCSRGLSS